MLVNIRTLFFRKSFYTHILINNYCIHFQEILRLLLESQARVDALYSQSPSIVPVHLRKLPVKNPLPVVALTSYVHDKVTVFLETEKFSKSWVKTLCSSACFIRCDYSVIDFVMIFLLYSICFICFWFEDFSSLFIVFVVFQIKIDENSTYSLVDNTDQEKWKVRHCSLQKSSAHNINSFTLSNSLCLCQSLIDKNICQWHYAMQHTILFDTFPKSLLESTFQRHLPKALPKVPVCIYLEI